MSKTSKRNPARKAPRKRAQALRAAPEPAITAAQPETPAAPAGYAWVETDWMDRARRDLDGLQALLRVIERHIEMVPYQTPLDDLTAGDVGALAGLAYDRAHALSEYLAQAA